jgi:hypothetical protein
LNGWTGTVKYAKNSLGLVNFQAELTAGTVASYTNILTFPSAYIPKTTTRTSIVSNSYIL